MKWQCFLVIFSLVILRVYAFGENGTGIWRFNSSTPSAVYPLYDIGKTQGVMRIHIRPGKTILSDTSITTTSPPFDVLMEEYFKKNGKDRFDDWYTKTNEADILNSTPFICLIPVFCTFFVKLYHHKIKK